MGIVLGCVAVALSESPRNANKMLPAALTVIGFLAIVSGVVGTAVSGAKGDIIGPVPLHILLTAVSLVIAPGAAAPIVRHPKREREGDIR